MRLLKPVAVLAACTAVGSGVAVAVVKGTEGSSSSTTVVTKSVTLPAPAPLASTSPSSLSVGDIYRRNVRGIVEIRSTIPGSSGQSSPLDPFGQGQPAEEAQGTGFVIDSKGDVVTNAHVVAGASKISVVGSDGSTYSATLVGSDPTTDVAVLRVDSPGRLQALALGDSSAVQVGDGVVAIGDPFGLTNTVTTGVVSALNRTITSPNDRPINGVIQTDAAINHGNSGGPLFNGRGEVIGITSQIYAGNGASGNVGIGFAVPSNTVRTIANEILNNGKASHAFLGVYLESVSSTAAKATGMPVGVEITSVKAGSPAAKAGLHGSTGRATVGGVPVPTGGDVITELNGQAVSSTTALIAKISAMHPGQQVTLTYVRAGQSHTVTITLGSIS